MRTAALLLSAALLAGVVIGVGCFRRGGTPETEPPEAVPLGPAVRVVASYPGASAQVVAETVAAIEQQVNGVEDAEWLESESHSDGSYVLTVRFKPGTDINVAAVVVQNRVNLTLPRLPDLVRHLGVTVDRADPQNFPPLWVALTSPDKTYDEMYLHNFAALRVRDELAGVAGVADVRAVSRTRIALRFHPDADKLAARGVTVADVVRAIQQQNVRVAAGQLGRPPEPVGGFQFTLTAERLKDVEQLNDVIVHATADGAIIRLRDVGTIELGKKTDGSAWVNGTPAALLAVHTQPNASPADDLRKVMAELQNVAPKGLEVRLAADLTADRFAVVEVRLPDAASLARTQEVVAHAEKLIRGVPGTAECLAFSEREPNAATVLVKLTAKDPAAASDIRKVLAGVKDATVRVSDFAVGRPFPVRIAIADTAGHGYEKLRAEADAVVERIKKDGIALDPAASSGRASPQLSIRIDREKAAELGVPVADVYTTLRAHLGDTFVNDFNGLDSHALAVAVEADRVRNSPDALKDLRVKGADGQIVRLGTIAEFREVTALPAVMRVNLYPAVVVTAVVPPGKSLAEVSAACVKAAEAEVPKGFKVFDLSAPKPR